MSESPEEKIRREEREKEDEDFTKAIEDSYRLVRKLATDNNPLEDYNRTESKIENLHLALIIVGEGRATHTALYEIYNKVSKNNLLKAIGISMVAGFTTMVILNLARLLFPTIFS